MGQVTYRAIKGTRDLLPPESERFAAAEALAREVFGSYGYAEIRTPILEATELFARSVGEATDIVHKEMYTFLDRKGRSLTMRPENTAGVVRALVERGVQELSKPIRLWYAGPQFRYEQPQAGRYREFHQIGAELVGAPSAEADAELLGMLFVFLRRLGYAGIRARVNCVPTGQSRDVFSAALREHLSPHAERFGADDRRRLEQNPLRLFDSKDRDVRKLLEGAPKTLDFLDDRAREHHEAVKRLLPACGVDFQEDASLVRGLDYYTLTVFEVTSGSLGAQDAILGGGRYDNLFEELGGPSMPAVGFAIGEDRLVAAAPEDLRPERPLIVVVPDSREEFAYALAVSDEIRACRPEAVVETDFAGRGIVKGLARAARAQADLSKQPFRLSGVHVALLGQREREGGTVTLKDLSTGQQRTFARQNIAEELGAAREA
jgi:histidyl-tRNA synthetase